MKHFLRGIALQVAIELIIALGIYSLTSALSATYLDSGPFLVEYPAIVGLLVAAYTVVTKRSYTLAVGHACGVCTYLCSFIRIARRILRNECIRNKIS